MRLAQLLDMSVVQRLAEANFNANGMPIGIIDAVDGSILIGYGWQEICTRFHRADLRALERCRESDDYIKAHLTDAAPCEYRCRNGLRDIGVPILVAGAHLATMFMGQFFYEGEVPDRDFFARQAREFGFDEAAYLAALDRVPTFTRRAVENIVAYDRALARFIADLAERALVHARDETALREADRRKNEFLGVLSHELRNPLAPIRNALQLLDRVAPGGERARWAKAVVDRQVDHLARLVDDLLDVTRISRGKIHLHRSRFDLAALVSRTVEDHRSLFEERGIDVEVRTAPGSFWVDADETRLAQVLGNLLQNGAKFTDRGGRVTVVLEGDGQQARLSVRDTGVGIAPEVLSKIFEPFSQGEESLQRSSGGLGLGLALVKALVELHGGAVEARSDGAGQGAELSVRLQLAPGRAGAGREPGRPTPAGSRQRVLIIEDNVDAADTLREIVELENHQALVAHDGREGLEKARAFRPQIILCDIGLPTMSGYEIARAIRSDVTLASIRLVAVTGYARPEDQLRAMEAGFDRHLTKPISFAALGEVLSASR